MMDGSGAGMWFGGGFMWLIWIALAVLVVYLIAAATRSTSAGTGRPRDAMEILRERYARGEIDEEEFERRRRELEKQI